ncbi:DUF6059 family protein [Streptomyces ficellus]|uniref:Uncharacterized protein n=1 Tax=Streptomyces ficellus TaxID=1977088 RepID=A0A6I6F0M6_9ACTN|nr:DUF6059 family protein [Streptomyces ficellus]QGV77473.1 hypothetical protein EIZ62_03830 [Streptomyces ficellus]
MRAIARFLRGCYDALAAAGWLWLGVPMPPPPEQRPALRPPPDPPPALRPPAAGHPERVRPDLPPSSTERALWRQLMEPTGDR